MRKGKEKLMIRSMFVDWTARQVAVSDTDDVFVSGHRSDL